jgi:hypothetical protein
MVARLGSVFGDITDNLPMPRLNSLGPHAYKAYIAGESAHIFPTIFARRHDGN